MLKKIITSVQRFFNSEILKVFSFTSLSTFIKMLAGLISVKVISLIVGPSGIALLGQLNNFTSIGLSLGSGGINNGVIKYVAEHKKDEQKLKIFLSVALKITVVCSLVFGLLTIFLSKFLSEYILYDAKFYYVFIIFGISLLFYALNTMLLSIINGLKEFKKYVLINIGGSLVSLVFSVSSVYSFGLSGALVSAVTFQSVVLIVTIFFTRKMYWLSWDYFKDIFDIEVLKKYLKYSLMSFVSVVTVPIVQLILRGYIISEISSDDAGYWEGINRLSTMYLAIITSSFSVYYLPKLSEIKDNKLLKKEIFNAYKIIIPILLLGLTIVYFLRFFIIKLIFTAKFVPMEKLFFWQLLGDFFKISSFILAFLMLAKSMTKLFTVTQIIFSVFLLGVSFAMMKLNALDGVVQGYMITYFMYLLTMIYVFRKLLFSK